MRRGELLLAAALLAASAGARKPAPADWRAVVSSHDRERLKAWRTAWEESLTQARAGGAGAAVAAEGTLLDPDAALDRPETPAGAYRCRTIKLGTQIAGGPAYRTSPAYNCRIAEGVLTQLDGPQRPSGRLFAYDGARILFVGGLALSDEVGSVRYGRDPQRNLIGLLERIGPARWRVILPRPAWESKLAVLELVPGG